MLNTLISISSLLVGYAFLFCGNALLTTLVSLRADTEGFLLVEIGFINTAYFLGLYIGAKYTDYFVASVGHTRTYAAFASMGAICALLHPIIVDPYAWVVIRFGTGVCAAGILMITESWLNARASRANRGQVLSMYMITHFMATGLGQLLIPFAEPKAFQLFSMAAIGYAFSLIPVSISRTIAPPIPPRQKVRFINVFRSKPVAMSGALCCGVISAALYGLAPVYALGVGLSTEETSYFMALLIFSGVLLQWPVGRLSDRLGRRKLMAVICMISGILAFVLVASANHSFWLFLAASTAFGAFNFSVYPVALAYMNDATPPEKLLAAAAGMLTAFSVGAIISPILASLVMELFGYHALFVYMAVVFVVYASLVLWRIRVKPAPERKKFKRIFRGSKPKKKSAINIQKIRDEQDRDIARLIKRQ